MKEHTKRSEPNTAVNVFRYSLLLNAAYTVDEAVCNKSS